ncbi:carbohydrate ABC transporter permease, partial [Paenibacillus sp. HN-1]|nr:carbohydrate ABC transporter permease [Paenibacillus sinensis]
MKTTLGDRLFQYSLYIILTILMVITIYPLVHVALASVSSPNEIIAHKGILLKPLHFNLDAYRMVFSNPSIYTGYRNTLFIVVVGVFLNLTITALGAYVLSRKQV